MSSDSPNPIPNPVIPLEQEEAFLATLTPGQKAFYLASLASTKQSPKGYANSSVAPYYNARFGNWLKVTLDKIISLGESDREFKFYPKDFGITYRSLQMRINQAWQWLVDKNDTPDGAYDKLRRKIYVMKDIKGGGIRLAWKENIAGIAIAVDPLKHNWKNELDSYIEAAKEEEIFVSESVDLSEDDIDWVKIQFKDLPQFHIMKLSRNVIKIVKSTEMAKELAKKSTHQKEGSGTGNIKVTGEEYQGDTD